jgi:hypothetical protein
MLLTQLPSCMALLTFCLLLFLLLLLQSMVPVPPEAFLSVMMPAAAAGRMDVVRTMWEAVDQHLKLQVRRVTLTGDG